MVKKPFRSYGGQWVELVLGFHWFFFFFIVKSQLFWLIELAQMTQTEESILSRIQDI